MPSAENVTTIYFVRHAESDLQIHDDASRPLTEKGLSDGKAVADYLMGRKIDHIFSSPYKRAVDTIREFADRRHLPITLVDDFRERKTDSRWIEDFKKYSEMQWKDFGYRSGDGESLQEVQKRNIAALKHILKDYEGRNIVIGTHGTALSTILNYYNPAFDLKEFRRIVGILPWLVKVRFEKTELIDIGEIDLD